MAVSLIFLSLLGLAVAAPAWGGPQVPPGAAPEEPPPTFRVFERRPYTLSEKEFEEIRRRVMSRCHVTAVPSAKTPWYFHYELGLELAKKGDPQRALDELIEAVDRKPEPRRGTRMYGVWFIDYLPYLQIANMHAQLGNWDCAMDALRLSAAHEKPVPLSRESQLFDELLQQIKKRRSP